jgi:hypothetical protein
MNVCHEMGKQFPCRLRQQDYFVAHSQQSTRQTISAREIGNTSGRASGFALGLMWRAREKWDLSHNISAALDSATELQYLTGCSV